MNSFHFDEETKTLSYFKRFFFLMLSSHVDIGYDLFHLYTLVIIIFCDMNAIFKIKSDKLGWEKLQPDCSCSFNVGRFELKIYQYFFLVIKFFF